VGAKSLGIGKGYRYNLVALILISFLIPLGFSAANLLIPYYILALKGVLNQLPEKVGSLHAYRAAVEMGILVSAFMGTRAVFAAASGWLSDKIGRKKMIVTGMSLYAILGVLYAATTSVWQLYVLRGVQGVASALVWPVAETLIVESVEERFRTRALSLYVMASNVGNIVGPVIGGIAYEVSKRLFASKGVLTVLRVPFILITIATAIGAVMALFIRETLGRETRERGGKAAFQGGLLELPEPVKRGLTAFYVNGLFNGIAVGIMSSIMYVYILDFIAKTPTSVATIMLIGGVAGLAVSYPAAHFADKLDTVSRKRVLVATFAAARGLLALIGFVKSYWVFVVIAALLNIAMNISIPLLRTLQAELVPARLRGRVFGLQQAFFNTGMVVGPLIGGPLYRYLYGKEVLPGVAGPELVFLLASLLGLTGVAFLARLYDPVKVNEAWQSLMGVGAGRASQAS
jgi:MFS family permease